MRIAFPFWEDKISPVLDTASRLKIIEIADQKEVSRSEALLDDQDLTRKCLCIRKLNVDILICGAVSRSFFKMLYASGIHIIPGISGPAEKVLKAYLQGKLTSSDFFMPGFDGKGLMQ